jgi:hypothetical protein
MISRPPRWSVGVVDGTLAACSAAVLAIEPYQGDDSLQVAKRGACADGHGRYRRPAGAVKSSR